DPGRARWRTGAAPRTVGSARPVRTTVDDGSRPPTRTDGTSMPKDLDRVDREIVRLVSAQGRMSHEEIARRVHVSRPAVHERVKRLERDGVIRGYRAVVDWSAVDLGLCAFVSVQVDHERLGKVVDQMF